MKIENQSIVFVVEKPSLVRILAPLISLRWPSHQTYAVTTTSLGLYEYRYPRGLRADSFPYISEPAWKPRTYNKTVWDLATGMAIQTDLDHTDVLVAAQTIYYAADTDASGASAFQVLLSQCLGEQAVQVVRPALYLGSWNTQGIEKALDHPATTAAPFFLQWANAGAAKRFFDFNYNVNSLALFSGCLREVGVTLPNYTMSKYSLQLLYALQKNSVWTEKQAFDLMYKWPGTGRYIPTSLGSATSRDTILFGLIDAELLNKNAENQISVSDRGLAFLQLIHPDCQDADLPARLQDWASTWPNSKSKVQQYLRTFFGKQKRIGKKPIK